MIAPAMPPMKKPSATMMIASEIGPRISAPDPPPPRASLRDKRGGGKRGVRSYCLKSKSSAIQNSTELLRTSHRVRVHTRPTRAAGSGGRRASDFGRMNFIEKFTALLDYIEYAGLNHFGTESD